MKKTTCVVPGCDSLDTQNDSIKFHQIPKEADVRKKWLKAINRTEAEINKKSRVCSKHFKTHDYAITRLNYTMGGKSTASSSKNTCEFKALKTEAVPNLLLPQKSTFKIKISKKDNSKQIKVEEIKVKEEKIEKPEKVKMPKRPAPPDSPPPRSRTQSRRAASKEALKQMQLLLDDENDAVEIPDEDISSIDPSPLPPPPPKKKYKLSHRKSSDGNDRDVIVLKTITNRDAENTLELDCWVEQLEQVQKDRMKKIQEEEKEIQAKLDTLVSQSNGKVIHKGELNTVIEVSEQVQSAIQGAQATPTSLIINNNLGGQQSYQLIMDPRVGLVVGAVSQAPPTPTTQKLYQGKVQVAQNLQQTPTTSSNQGAPRIATRTRGRGSTNKITPPPPVVTPTRSKAGAQTLAQLQATPHTRGSNQNRAQAQATPPTRAQAQVTPPARAQAQPTPPTRAQAQAVATRGQAQTSQTRGQIQTAPQTRGQIQAAPQTRGQIQTTSQTRGQIQAAPQTRAQIQTPPQTRAQASPTPQTRAQATPPQTRGKAGVPTAKKQVTVVTPNTRGRGPAPNTFTTSVRPSETNVEGGLTAGSTTPGAKKVVVDLTADDNNRSAPDSREISFNKLQGKTYPSLVVVARPHLRVQDLSLDRPKLDAKVKSVLMHAPTKFTEWLIQQGLIRSEQKCSVHTNTQLKLGMYSDVSKFPYSGGYVWISECCPQRFVSVFSGSLFEGSPHPPMVILKLLYHWSCQTNIQNVTQWVKVDNLYVKGMFTWLRSICTVALQTHIRQIGGPGIKVEVGVISLGTTSQDGNQRQVKVEVLGVLESESKLIRLRAVEPQAEGDRNYKKRFSKILEPLIHWVHPQSILVADLTVDKQTLISMGFSNVVHYSSTQYGNNNQIMDYLRRIVPRMFQNTLSLLSRQIIQQFLDELVWREWFGTSSLQAFDNLIVHLSEQTRFDGGMSLIVRLNKVAQNPFKSWNMNLNNPTKVVENAKKSRTARKPDPPKVAQPAPAEVNRPPKSTSPDVPEQMVPLESYYYGTIDTYSKTPKITLNMKCPFCKSVFDNNIQLMSHLFKHAHNVSMDAQLCRYCLTSVATANDLLKHIATSHPAETKFDNGFCCLICETQYMNPFVLGKHMSKEHCPTELPYQCGTCGYRCSNHKQAIDHFYRTHDNGPTIQCPFCLKSTTVFTSSRNIVQNMNYFIQHLQKHQRKQFARRCGKCNLWFVQKDVLKDHQNKMHVSQRGKTGLVPGTAPRNGVMVPKSKMDKYPGDAEVINFAALKFDLSKGLMCKECVTPMDTPKHFPSFESCQNPNCQYSTCCTNAMQEHNAKCSKTNNPIAEERLPFEMYCICGFSNTDGNQMARHLATCERKSAYPSRSDSKSAIVTHSMLDVLGLVRKPEENPKPENAKPRPDSQKPRPKTEKRKRLKKEESLERAEKEAAKKEAVKDEDVMADESDKKKKEENDAAMVVEEDTKSKKDGTDLIEVKEDGKAEESASKNEEDKADVSVEHSAEETKEAVEKQSEDAEKVSDETEEKPTEDTEKVEQLTENATKILSEDTEKVSDEPEEKPTQDIEDKQSETEDNKENAEMPLAVDKVSEEPEEKSEQEIEDKQSETEDDKEDAEMPLAVDKVSEEPEEKSPHELEDKQSEAEDNKEDAEMPLAVDKVSEESEEKSEQEIEDKQSETEDNKDEDTEMLTADDKELEETPTQKNSPEVDEAAKETTEENEEATEDKHQSATDTIIDNSDSVQDEVHEKDDDLENENKEVLTEYKDDTSQDHDKSVTNEDRDTNFEDDSREDTSDSYRDKINTTEDKESNFQDNEDTTEDRDEEDTTEDKDVEDTTEDKARTDATEDKDREDTTEDKDREDTTEDKDIFHHIEDKDESSEKDFSEDKDLTEESQEAEDKDDRAEVEDRGVKDKDDVEDREFEDKDDELDEVEDGEVEVKKDEVARDAEDKELALSDEDLGKELETDSLEKDHYGELESSEKEHVEEPEEDEESKHYEGKQPVEETSDENLKKYPEEELDRSEQPPFEPPQESSEKQPLDFDASEREPSEKPVDYSQVQSDLPNHVLDNSMETSEITQDKQPTITSDDIQNLLSDVVGESDLASAMDTESDAKQSDDVAMTSPTEMMDIPDGSGDLPTPMETD